MKIILLGATGMIGQGVLRECLLDPEVESVLSIGRNTTNQSHPKLREIIHQDFMDFSSVQSELLDYDACFFCLGVSSVGMKEEEYTHITYGFTMAIAELLVKHNPQMTFIYVSGTGADSTEKSRIMWARVRGKTENALLKLPFKAVFIFRPAVVYSKHGFISRARLYRTLYTILKPMFALWKFLFPNHVITTQQFGLAMLQVSKYGSSKKILENQDINQLVQKK